MKKSLSILVLVAAVTWAAGCSTGADVRSDKGPSTTQAGAGDTSKDADATTTSAAAAGPKDSPALFLQGAVTVPAGEAGKLAVVSTGAPIGDSGSSVSVLVRNNTDKALTSIAMTGTARAADGSLAGSGSSRSFKPVVLNPGEWGFGYVYFSSTVPPDATVEITVSGDNVSSSFFGDAVQLTVNELNLVPGEYGSSSYVGIVTNPDPKKTVGSASVDIGCFDAASNLVDVFTGYIDGEAVAGGTASFSIGVYEAPECAAVAVGASGYGT